MNVQLKKGIVETCVLSSLRYEPSYGYKIINDISRIIEISESTLYPILRRLEVGGFLETFSQEYHGRWRKYYRITRLGVAKIEEFIDEWHEVESAYRFVLNMEERKWEKENF